MATKAPLTLVQGTWTEVAAAPEAGLLTNNSGVEMFVAVATSTPAFNVGNVVMPGTHLGFELTGSDNLYAVCNAPNKTCVVTVD